MDNKYLNEVLERLESYRKKEQQIELLRYELQHAKQVSPTELIEAMTFQTRDADGSQTDLYPKDVPGIAFSYQHIAAQLNEEAVGELISRYTALCHERDRFLHYIGLLDKRQQDVVRKHYFEQQSWSEIAASMDLTPRTVQRTRQQALDNLQISTPSPTVFFGGRRKERETSFKIKPPQTSRRHCITRRAVVQ